MSIIKLVIIVKMNAINISIY